MAKIHLQTFSDIYSTYDAKSGKLRAQRTDVNNRTHWKRVANVSSDRFYAFCAELDAHYNAGACVCYNAHAAASLLREFKIIS